MKHFTFLTHKLTVLFVFFLSLFVFISCETEDDTEILSDVPIIKPITENLFGTWKSAYGDSYIISKDSETVSITYDDGGWGYGYKASVYGITDNLIIIKFSEVGTLEDQNSINNYSCIFYENLTSSTVNMAEAYKEGSVLYKSTPEEAASEFTKQNGYYGYTGEYIKN